MEDKLLLTIDANYSRLTGGIERWLCRLVCKNAGCQPEALDAASQEITQLLSGKAAQTMA